MTTGSDQTLAVVFPCAKIPTGPEAPSSRSVSKDVPICKRDKFRGVIKSSAVGLCFYAKVSRCSMFLQLLLQFCIVCGNGAAKSISCINRFSGLRIGSFFQFRRDDFTDR